MKTSAIATLHEIKKGDYDTIVDVRSPAEYAEDHLPGAISSPVLDNEQRAQIGTLYKQESAFAARKLGAAFVSINIARHLQTQFIDKPKNWRPLIYCWRGGQRSGAMTLVLRQIGWGAAQLEGGYKAYRQQVLTELDVLSAQFSFLAITGSTGSGKTRLLNALQARGAQTLDLEALAAHKGSVLGLIPHTEQPSQKMFDSLLLARLQQFNPQQPV